MVISNAPSRLSPNARNNAAMNPFTHGLEPSCTTPNGPRMAVVSRPSPENSTMIPRQKTTACATPSRRPPAGRFRKYDMVMGIMGKTQGVKMEARPKPNATSRNAPKPCGLGLRPSRPALPRAGLASAYPAGIAEPPPRAPPGPRSASRRPSIAAGTHCVSLQV